MIGWARSFTINRENALDLWTLIINILLEGRSFE